MGRWTRITYLLVKTGTPLIFLLLLTATLVRADDMEEGYQALKRGDYETARQLFDQQAHQGNRYARYNLGVMYLEGLGVEVDPVNAYLWFQLAARQGDSLASQSAIILLRSLTPGQLIEARKRIQEWDKKVP